MNIISNLKGLNLKGLCKVISRLNAPARLALKESDRPINNPRGRQKTKWLEVMKTQLYEIDAQ